MLELQGDRTHLRAVQKRGGGNFQSKEHFARRWVDSQTVAEKHRHSNDGDINDGTSQLQNIGVTREGRNDRVMGENEIVHE